MRFIPQLILPLALVAAVAALTSPARASAIGNIDAFALAPVGNVSQHGIDYGLGYRVGKLGPVSFSPLSTSRDMPALRASTSALPQRLTSQTRRCRDRGGSTAGFCRLHPHRTNGCRRHSPLTFTRVSSRDEVSSVALTTASMMVRREPGGIKPQTI